MELHTLYKRLNGQEEKGYRRIMTRQGYLLCSLVEIRFWDGSGRTKGEKKKAMVSILHWFSLDRWDIAILSAHTCSPLYIQYFQDHLHFTTKHPVYNAAHGLTMTGRRGDTSASVRRCTSTFQVPIHTNNH